MILSKICKSGLCEDGVTNWNTSLSAWILEHADESEIFRPFFALSADGEQQPTKDQFNPSEEGLINQASNCGNWQPIRPESKEQLNRLNKNSVFEAAVEVSDHSSLFDDEDDFPMVDFDGDAVPSENSVEQASEATEDPTDFEDKPTYEEGFQAGMAQGIEQGQKDAERIADQKVASLRLKVDSVLDAMIESRQMALEELDDDLARLSMHIARQILRGELSMSPVAINQLVKVSLENFSPDDAPRVCLNPDDLELIRQVNSTSFEKVTWVADENLSSGSVRVECGERRSEDLVEERLSAVANKLLKDVDAIFLKPVGSLSFQSATDDEAKEEDD
jgi:flagellar biosynthesis/type III secretory pathway protein FliH